MPTLQQRRLLLADFPFSPATIPGLCLWLDASRIGGLAEGDPIPIWSDLSGLGNHATQGTQAKQPTLRRGALNGLDVARFDGADDVMYVDSLASIFTGTDQPHTVIALLKKASNAAQHMLFYASSSGGDAPFTLVRTSATAQYEAQRRDDASTLKTVTEGTGSSDTSPHILTTIFTGTLVSLRRDGNAVFTDQDLNVGALTLNRVTIGARRVAAGSETQLLAADVAVLLAYNRAVNASEYGYLERGLGRRASIAVAA